MPDDQDHIVQSALMNLLSPRIVSFSNEAYLREVSVRIGRSKTRGQRSVARSAQARPRRITLLERPSGKTLTVFWSDVCTGHYAEQIWAIGYARRDAVCDLTAIQIFKGDMIFRPRVKRTALPANWDRMILASEVNLYFDNVAIAAA
jgi:hypothetical protein